MDDVEGVPNATGGTGPEQDSCQDHIADLEARGLGCPDRQAPGQQGPELHPLCDLQFIGGIPRGERRVRSCSPNVVDSTCGVTTTSR